MAPAIEYNIEVLNILDKNALNVWLNSTQYHPYVDTISSYEAKSRLYLTRVVKKNLRRVWEKTYKKTLLNDVNNTAVKYVFVNDITNMLMNMMKPDTDTTPIEEG